MLGQRCWLSVSQSPISFLSNIFFSISAPSSFLDLLLLLPALARSPQMSSEKRTSSHPDLGRWTRLDEKGLSQLLRSRRASFSPCIGSDSAHPTQSYLYSYIVSFICCSPWPCTMHRGLSGAARKAARSHQLSCGGRLSGLGTPSVVSLT